MERASVKNLKLNRLLIAVLTLTATLILSVTPANAAGGFTLNYEKESFVLDQDTLASFKGLSRLPENNLLQTPTPLSFALFDAAGFKVTTDEPPPTYVHSSLDKVANYVQKLAEEVINTTTTEPVLIIENGRVKEFVPPQNGRKLDIYHTTLNLLQALEQRATSTEIVVNQTSPRMTLSQTNNLGINELIGRGESNFAGSPANRRHNIKVGLEKFKGLIVPPGAEFSFNKNLGPVEAAAGFLPELVIKASGTVPELGGGLCQVSSTTFRAAVNAGLPITQRKNHSYAVRYYSPQGTDATIYPGVIDLKFINDTPGSILIWPYLKDKDNLVFDFYGTKDGREVTTETPQQYDKKPDGSMKATWIRHVFKNSTSTTDIFKSVYLPPALFHKEEVFITSSATSTNGTAQTLTPANN